MNYHPLNLPIEGGRLTDDINAPTSRRDLTRIENVAWCIRNLAINNAKHPMLKPTLGILCSHFSNIFVFSQL